MAVSFDAGTESHTGTTGSASEASFSFSHNPVSTPKGVLVFAWANSATNPGGTITYGGVDVPAVTGGLAVDSAGEVGSMKVYFLGSGIPTDDPATVVVNRTNNATVMWAVCITVTALGDTEIYDGAGGIVLQQGDEELVEQNITDDSPGTDSLRFAGTHSGLATPPTVGASSTLVHSFDPGLFTASVVRETTAGQGSRPVGFAPEAIDDTAAVHLNVREVAVAPSPKLPLFPRPKRGPFFNDPARLGRRKAMPAKLIRATPSAAVPTAKSVAKSGGKGGGKAGKPGVASGASFGIPSPSRPNPVNTPDTDRRIFDRVIGGLNMSLKGSSRNSAGVLLGNCRLLFFRTEDNSFAGETTSDANGDYKMPMMKGGPFFIVGYKPGAPDATGASINTRAPDQD